MREHEQAQHTAADTGVRPETEYDIVGVPKSK